MKLTSLKARSVRGIPQDWVDMPIGNRGMVIFGPNGVGKSSIVDALEYAISARTSLYPVRRQNVNWDTGAPHIRGGQPDIAVQVSDGGESFDLAPESEPDEISNNARAWIATARNASFVMRRHMLLRFILEEPKDRYALLEPFMNLGMYQDVESALRDWKSQLESAHDVANTTVGQRQQPLRNIFVLDPLFPITEAALIERLNVTLQELGLGAVTERNGLEVKQAEVAGELGGAEQNARLAALGGLKSESQHLGRASNFEEMFTGLIAALDDLDREIQTRTEAILTDLLVRGKEAIEAAGLETCPICEQDINRSQVVARLNERIQEDERITAAQGLVKERRDALVREVRTLLQSMMLFMNHWEQHIETPLPAEYAQTVALLNSIETTLAAERPNAQQTREFAPRLSATVADHNAIMETLNQLIEQEGGGERRTKLSTAASMIEALLTDWPLYEAAAKQAGVTKGQKETVTRLHGHAVEARKVAVQATLSEVAATANEYYEAIHPNEGIATSDLQVRDLGHGSVILSSDFHGSRESPLLHYSESHLDTLGLSYFLALRKHEALKAPEFKVLVLDDVMHSVDSDHRGRIARLVKREFGDHQIVITTHDVYFYDALRREFGTGGYTYGRIYNWDLERGPVLGDPLTDFDRITVPEEREHLSQEMLAAAAGRFFEWLLREATEALEVAVVARFKGNHEIGQLWPAFAARMRKQKGYLHAHNALIDGLEMNGWVRNACGAHYNPSPAAASPQEVREFAELLAALYETLFCKECGMFIVRQSADRSWRCLNNHIVYAERVTGDG